MANFCLVLLIKVSLMKKTCSYWTNKSETQNAIFLFKHNYPRNNLCFSSNNEAKMFQLFDLLGFVNFWIERNCKFQFICYMLHAICNILINNLLAFLFKRLLSISINVCLFLSRHMTFLLVFTWRALIYVHLTFRNIVYFELCFMWTYNRSLTGLNFVRTNMIIWFIIAEGHHSESTFLR